MAGNIYDLPMSEVMRPLILKFRITGVNVFRARLWLGAQLIKLAALVIGCGVEVSIG